MQRGIFTVHHTSLCSGEQQQRAEDAELFSRPNPCPLRAKKLQHQAMSTGRPGWIDVPATPAGKADCRTVAIAMEQDKSYTRRAVWENSWTSRTGIHPYRPTLHDRLHGLLALVGTAYSLQRKRFDNHQREYAKRAQAVGVDCTPEDVMLFEFNLSWKELREELHSMLSQHMAALRALQTAAPGSYEHQAASAVSQRTSPETLVLALSSMSIFDSQKWGSDACPYDEAEYMAALNMAKAAFERMPAIHVDPAVNDDDDDDFVPPHGNELSPCKNSAMSPSINGACSTNNSFFPQQCCASAALTAGPDSRQATPTATTEDASPVAPVSGNHSFAKIPSLDDVADAELPQHEEDVRLANSGTSPVVSGRVSPPPRPTSIAACLNPADIQERQATMAAYRTRVLQQALAWRKQGTA